MKRPLVLDQKITDPFWLAGFTSGEGNFMVGIRESPTHKLGFRVELRFALVQHSRDEQLIRGLADYLNCGTIMEDRNAFYFRVFKFSDIVEKIIPFFNQYPIQGVKHLDYLDFCQVAELIKQKKHLTVEGLEQIKQIKARMNAGRKSD
jgi:hypothetical protein